MSYSNPQGQPTTNPPSVVEDPSKASGMYNKAIGSVKQNLGHAFGAQDMEQRGASQRAMGDAELEAARSKSAAEGASKQVEGSYKESYGSAAGKPGTSTAGTAERLVGEAQQSWNK